MSHPKESSVERLARAIWNRLPYDHETCQPTCPQYTDALRAVRAALGDARLDVVDSEVLARIAEQIEK